MGCHLVSNQIQTMATSVEVFLLNTVLSFIRGCRRMCAVIAGVSIRLITPGWAGVSGKVRRGV